MSSQSFHLVTRYVMRGEVGVDAEEGDRAYRTLGTWLNTEDMTKSKEETLNHSIQR